MLVNSSRLQKWHHYCWHMTCFGGVSAGCSPPNFCNLVCAVLLAQQMSWRHKSVSLQRHHYNPSMQQHRDSQMAQKLCREIATINGKDEIFCRKLEFMRLLPTTLLHHQLVFWQCFFSAVIFLGWLQSAAHAESVKCERLWCCVDVTSCTCSHHPSMKTI